MYFSLGNTVPNGFGTCWTHPYNLRIEDNTSVNGGGGGAARTGAAGVSGSTNYLVLPNAARVSFTTGTTRPSATTPTIACTVQAGMPYAVNWKYDATTRGTYFTVTTEDRSVWRFQDDPSLNPAVQVEYPVQVTDRVGNYITLSWAPATYTTQDTTTKLFTGQALQNIKASNGNTLLTVNYGANNMISQVVDAYGRIVNYSFQFFANGGVPNGLQQQSAELTGASFIGGTGTRFAYGYGNGGNGEAGESVWYLTKINTPNLKTGTGMTAATINYNSSGLVTSAVDANGNKRQFLSVPNGTGGSVPNAARVQVLNPAGTLVQQFDLYWDNLMNETSRVDQLGRTVFTRSFGSSNEPYKPSSVTDGNNRTWSFTYDLAGHTLTATTPKQTLTTNTYAYSNFSLGELTSSQTGGQTATSFTYYEPSGLTHTVSTPVPGNPSGSAQTQTSTYSYDSVGNLTQVSSPGNNATAYETYSFGYTSDGSYTQAEALGEPITVTDPLGKVTHLRYDSQRNVLSSTDALGNQTTATYNVANQVYTVSAPATGQTGTGHATTTTLYSFAGGPAATVTASNESGTAARSVSYGYGLEGELLSRSGSAEPVALSYDAAYHVASLADGNGHTTNYSYDLVGNLALASYPLAAGGYDTVAFSSYDPVGNPLGRVDGNGQATAYAYADNDGLLSSVAYTGKAGQNVSLAYDQYDRLTGVTDAAGSYSAMLDDLGLTVSGTRTYAGLGPQTAGYTFYPDGSRSGMTNVAGAWGYTYDSVGRYVGMTSPGGACAASYYDNGWQASRTLPDGVVTSYAYNPAGMLTSLSNKTSASSTLSSYGAFTYDGVFNMLGATSTVPGSPGQGGATSYGYDSSDRLTGEASARNGGLSNSYAYDAAFNPTTFRNVATTFDADNRQTSGGTFVYDGNGNPTAYKGSAFGYDVENRATSMGSGWSATYRADGLRASKTVSGVSTYYLYDGGEPVVELSASGAVQAVNVFAPDGLSASKQSGSWTN